MSTKSPYIIQSAPTLQSVRRVIVIRNATLIARRIDHCNEWTEYRDDADRLSRSQPGYRDCAKNGTKNQWQTIRETCAEHQCVGKIADLHAFHGNTLNLNQVPAPVTAAGGGQGVLAPTRKILPGQGCGQGFS